MSAQSQFLASIPASSAPPSGSRPEARPYPSPSIPAALLLPPTQAPLGDPWAITNLLSRNWDWFPEGVDHSRQFPAGSPGDRALRDASLPSATQGMLAAPRGWEAQLESNQVDRVRPHRRRLPPAWKVSEKPSTSPAPPPLPSSPAPSPHQPRHPRQPLILANPSILARPHLH